MASPRDVLVAYSKQEATTEQVWRALIEHGGWYVPAGYAVKRLHTAVSEGLTIFATEIPTRDSALILFTDPVAAGHADGAPIGPFMREFSGVKVFQALDNGYGSVRVNPHSPKSEGWYISQEAFPLRDSGRRWFIWNNRCWPAAWTRTSRTRRSRRIRDLSFSLIPRAGRSRSIKSRQRLPWPSPRQTGIRHLSPSSRQTFKPTSDPRPSGGDPL